MARVASCDVLITLMGAPHDSDQLTSVLRLTQALLDEGAHVQVWACGYATMLTQRSLSDRKPRNVAEWSTAYPSTAALVRGLMTTHPDRMRWYGCKACSEHRGATDHIEEVRMRPPYAFAAHVAAATTTVFIGVM